MIRKQKYEMCKSAIDGTCDHLHISKDAVVQYFLDNVKSELYDDGNYLLIDVNVSETSRSHILQKIHHEAKSEYSFIEKIKGSVNIFHAIPVLLKQIPQISPIGSVLEKVARLSDSEAEPFYKKVQDDFAELSSRDNVVVVINNKSNQILDEFGWIAEIDLPSNVTIVTHGYATCNNKINQQEQIRIGRLSKSQTRRLVELELNEDGEISAQEVHEEHDGNPYAIKQAVRSGNPTESIGVEEVWNEVYDHKVTPEENQLLIDSAHLVDLRPEEISRISRELSITDVRKILASLKKKGVILKSESNIYSVGEYLQEHYLAKLDKHIKQERHREAFEFYLNKWATKQANEVESNTENTFQDLEDSPEITQYLYLSLEHFYNIDPDMSRAKFKDIFEFLSNDENRMKDSNLEMSKIFSFGLIAQRLVYDDAKKAVRDLSEVLFGTSMNVEEAFFEGVWSTVMEDSVAEIISELSKGWSSDELRIGKLGTKREHGRKKAFRGINENVSSELLEQLPSDVENSIFLLCSLTMLDNQQGREAYQIFGKTLEENGLGEEPFCNFLNEFNELVKICRNNADSAGSRNILEEFDSIDNSIRNRTDVIEVLDERRTNPQEKFDNLLLEMKDRKRKINDQLIRAGKNLERADNPIFAYVWYLLANELSHTLFEASNKDLFRLRVEYYKEREFWEEEKDIEMSAEELKHVFDKIREEKEESDLNPNFNQESLNS